MFVRVGHSFECRNLVCILVVTVVLSSENDNAIMKYMKRVGYPLLPVQGIKCSSSFQNKTLVTYHIIKSSTFFH